VLTERERHALLQIEQAMRAESPELFGSLTRMEPEPESNIARRRHDAAIVASAVAAILCVAVGAAGGAVVAVLFTVVVVSLRRWRFPGRRAGLLVLWRRPG
jgi:Protein of unknown function (DUF3040)